MKYPTVKSYCWSVFQVLSGWPGSSARSYDFLGLSFTIEYDALRNSPEGLKLVSVETCVTLPVPGAISNKPSRDATMTGRPDFFAAATSAALGRGPSVSLPKGCV